MKSTKLLCASALALLGTVPVSALACGTEPYLGQVCTFSFDYCPEGYVRADGRQMPVNANQALFSLLGVKFGGDGKVYFNLPDLRGRTAIGTGTANDGTTTQLGVKYGSPGATITLNNLPPHIHPASATLTAGSLMDAPVTLQAGGGTVTGQTLSGTVKVNALNGLSAPGPSAPVPTATANSVGKIGLGNGAYYPQGGTPIAVPSTHNLTVTGGTVSGANATGTLKVPAATTSLPVTVAANNTTSTPMPTISPNLGVTACIAVVGYYPPRP